MPDSSRLGRFLARDWFRSPALHPHRSLRLLRIVVGLVLLMHPLHALLHPEDARVLGQALGAKGLILAWGAFGLQGLCALGLVAGRFTTLACAGQALVLLGGIALTQAPYWYVVGGAAVQGHPGMEFSLLLLACLGAVAWGQRSPERGLDLARWAAAGIIATHPLHGFYDYKNLGPFGQSFDHVAFGHGLVLVWTMLLIQTACSLALLLRRFVAPAAFGHLIILSLGIWLAHWPDWFVLGPGEGGMEYSVVLMACFLGALLAHWPRLDRTAASTEEEGDRSALPA